MQSFVAFVFTLVFTLLALPANVFAIDYNGISAYPANSDPNDKRTESWFIYSVRAGEQKNDSIVVVNNTNTTQVLNLYPADSAPTSGDGFALKQQVQTMDKVGSWIKLEKESITLAPNSKESIPFTLRVPDNEPVGLWSGGIMVSSVPTDEKLSGLNINVRLGVRVYVTVLDQKLTKNISRTEKAVTIVVLVSALAFVAIRLKKKSNKK